MSPKTVFVIGAGASKEFGLPIGSELINSLIEYLNIKSPSPVVGVGSGSMEVMSAILAHHRRSHHIDINDYMRAAWHIRDAVTLTSSIDTFIHIQSDPFIEACGKIGIAHSILRAEKSSSISSVLGSIKDSRSAPFKAIENTWLVKFFRSEIQSQTIDTVEDYLKNFGFVVFNYDRCIEAFLFLALRRTFRDASDAKIAQIVNSLEIFHPYGSLGVLPELGAPSVSFGAELYEDELLAAAENIRTYTEEIRDDETRNRVRSMVSSAETLVMLGFGYHKQNVDYIYEKGAAITKRIFGTAYKESDSNTELIVKDMRKFFKVRNYSSIFIRNDLTCSDFLDEYSRTITV